MDDLTQAESPADSLTITASWERSVDVMFVWAPFIGLVLALGLSQLASRSGSQRLATVALCALAAAWTWFTVTRSGKPTQLAQRWIRSYFVGFLVISAVLVVREPIFLIYGIVGFFHASLLRPWSLAFAAIGLTAVVVHMHTVVGNATTTNWSIYVGVVLIQTLAVGAGVYGGAKIGEIAEQRRKALRKLEMANKENEGLHAQLLSQAREAGVLDERQRMAREIHDTIAQGLTGVVTQIEAAHHSGTVAGEAKRHLDNASEIARQSLTEARRSVQALRPAPLEDSRLPEALREVVEQWAELNKVAADFHFTGDLSPLRPDVEVALLRTAQEGLANVAKHAGASRVGVTLSFMDTTISLDVRDNGMGFDAATAGRDDSFGLSAMAQRVANVNGVMQIESEPGDGTTIAVQVPLDPVEVGHE